MTEPRYSGKTDNSEQRLSGKDAFPRYSGKTEISEPRISGKGEMMLKQSSTEKTKPDKNASLVKREGDHSYPEFDQNEFGEEEK